METVAQIALNAHAGQVDKAGRDYVDGHLRPIAQAAAVFGEEAEAAAWLHDIIEDTPTTADELLGLGVPQRVVAAVQSVTRLDGEPYEELIGRAGAHPCGRYVKLADNAWNITCNPALAATRSDWAERMLRERYQPARARLLAACGLVPDSDVVRRMQAVLDRHYARLVPRAQPGSASNAEPSRPPTPGEPGPPAAARPHADADQRESLELTTGASAAPSTTYAAYPVARG